LIVTLSTPSGESIRIVPAVASLGSPLAPAAASSPEAFGLAAQAGRQTLLVDAVDRVDGRRLSVRLDLDFRL